MNDSTTLLLHLSVRDWAPGTQACLGSVCLVGTGFDSPPFTHTSFDSPPFTHTHNPSSTLSPPLAPFLPLLGAPFNTRCLLRALSARSFPRSLASSIVGITSATRGAPRSLRPERTLRVTLHSRLLALRVASLALRSLQQDDYKRRRSAFCSWRGTKRAVFAARICRSISVQPSALQTRTSKSCCTADTLSARTASLSGGGCRSSDLK